MQYYDPNNLSNNKSPYYKEEKKKAVVNSGSLAVAKVFLWFALGLFLTGVMTIGYPYLFVAMFGNGEGAYVNFLISTVVFCILALVFGIAISFTSLSKKGAGAIKTCYIIYAIALGGAFSSIVIMLPDYSYLLYAFLVSAGSFVLMGILGYATKGKIGVPVMFLCALIFGLSIVSLFNIFLFGNSSLYWIVSILCFVAILLVAGVDINRVLRSGQALAEAGSDKYIVYEAYMLYGDFVIVFYYVIRFLMIFGLSSKSK